ncbi:MAG: hypothetical protein IT303_09700 [Dehalococcoidia bacterium]|nr:hypothetical protein [Dehalococcoidia bacterium]
MDWTIVITTGITAAVGVAGILGAAAKSWLDARDRAAERRDRRAEVEAERQHEAASQQHKRAIERNDARRNEIERLTEIPLLFCVPYQLPADHDIPDLIVEYNRIHPKVAASFPMDADDFAEALEEHAREFNHLLALLRMGQEVHGAQAHDSLNRFRRLNQLIHAATGDS